jgi:hypothetical protein
VPLWAVCSTLRAGGGSLRDAPSRFTQADCFGIVELAASPLKRAIAMHAVRMSNVNA